MFVRNQSVVLLPSPSPYPMLQVLHRRFVLPITALAGTLLLHACSQVSPDASADPALTAGSAPTSAKRTIGTAADSLDGMQGHTFGEPLRHFPGLVPVSKEDELGVRWYEMPAGQERGWSGQHAGYCIIYYQFQDGRFALFRAVTVGLGGSPTALRKEAIFLFGPGEDRHDTTGGLDWEGERVRVLYSEKLIPPATCWLEVRSKPLMAVQHARQRAQWQADSAVSKL